MNYTILAYSIYLPVAILLTVLVANKLLSNAKVFYIDIFRGQNEQALSLNKLIQVGFYLIGFGCAFLRLVITPEYHTNYAGDYQAHYIDNAQEIMETLSIKVGGFVVILGIMLFLNLILILKQRRHSNRMAEQAAERNKYS